MKWEKVYEWHEILAVLSMTQVTRKNKHHFCYWLKHFLKEAKKFDLLNYNV